MLKPVSIIGFICLSLSFFGELKAQCPYGGINYGDVTPAFIGDTFVLTNFVWGGDQYTLQAIAGCTYTISMCGTAWDTQITVFNPSLVSVAYNDDFCGFQSQVTFTALVSGAYTIQVNQWNCGINFTSAAYFGVTLDSCAGLPGCLDPAACNYDSNATSDDGSCCYNYCVTLTMMDSFGDGWNGAIYTIYDDGGVAVASGSLNTAQSGNGTSIGIDNLCLVAGCYTMVAGGGSFDSEISYTLSGGVTTTVSGGGNSVVTFEVESGCPPPPEPCYDPDPSGCPAIDVGPDLTIDCFDPCQTVSITADVFETGASTSYDVCAIDYNPPYPFTAGTGFSIGIDDVWSGVITMPFDFCFFGTYYNQLLVGSNNVLTFDLTNAGGFCPWAFNATCPSPALPLNSIMGPYHDIDPSVCGDAKWAVLGTAPCRTFVMNFDNVCHFQCNSITSTTQIVLYETTNAIEVYIEDKPTCFTWNSGNAVIGVQDATGTTGFVPLNRNTGPWTASAEAWRFTPNGPANFTVDWFEGPSLVASGITADLCPSQPSQTYFAIATYTMCDGTVVTVSDDVTVVCAQIMLPIELVEFEAELREDKVRCNWETLSEINNDYFTLQKSKDGNIWVNLGEIDGAGNSLIPLIYEYWDPDPYEGLSYYRLMQTDFDGAFDHSEVRTIEYLPEVELSFYPNPGTGRFVTEANLNEFVVEVYDITGRRVAHSIPFPHALDLTDNAPGNYLVLLKNGIGEILGKEELVLISP